MSTELPQGPAPVTGDITDSDPNQPVLWKQMLGFILWSLLFVRFGGILILPAGIFTFCDAWVSGIYKKKGSKSFFNISPMGWALAMEGLFIVAFPLYALNRNKLKTRKGHNVFFILTIIFGAIQFFFFLLAVGASFYRGMR